MTMTAEEALAWLHSTRRLGSKPGLRRIEELLERLGNPQNQLRFVHVAGTNGKGSTCAMTESILRHAGYRTGLFISPYLEDFREKMQVNREMIPPDVLARLMSRLRETVEQMVQDGREHPSEFEMATALGFLYFFEEKCDIVVLEVGLGGRFDSTNVISACEVAVITSISLDHMEYLGDTTAQIAFEKCGIVKPGCRVVSYPAQPADAAEMIALRCREKGVPLGIPDEAALRVYASGLDGSHFGYKGTEYHIGLIGAHQIRNALTVLEIVEALRHKSFPITDEDVRLGLETARWAGRLEIVRKNPLCIIDGAHNADATAVLAEAIDSLLGKRRLIAIMAMLAKKDYEHCAPLLAARSHVFVATEVRSMPGTLPAAEMESLARQSFEGLETKALPDLAEAAAYALGIAGEDDVVLACGSLYMIGEIKPYLI